MAKVLPTPPRVGMVSLGCPKALVDSERILTKLRAEGYEMSPDYAGADVVLVNTCGFLDSAKEESLEAIGEAIAENGRVVVTGCMGKEADVIRKRFPDVLAVTGPQQYEEVVAAVHEAAPPIPSPYIDLVPEAGLKLTPRHYSYVKISEGCNHRCAFCIIPSIRGDLMSRRPDAILREAEKLVAAGTKELLVISQDTSAYGLDLKHATYPLKSGGEVRAHMTDLAAKLGELRTPEGDIPWVRLHYVYPYPHVDKVIPLMAEGKVLPYLDIPFQHASPKVLKAMKRPANEAKVLERLKSWRALVPDIAIRSSFVVGFPGETEEDFQYLLDWLEEARLDRVGAFKFEPVEGAAANMLPDPVPDEVKQDRYDRIMALSARISAEKLAAKVGQVIDVLIDRVDEHPPLDFEGRGTAESGGGDRHAQGARGAAEHGDAERSEAHSDLAHLDAPHPPHEFVGRGTAESGGGVLSVGATGRSKADAPEIDGEVHLRDAHGLKPGDFVKVLVEESDDHDLYGVAVDAVRQVDAEARS